MLPNCNNVDVDTLVLVLRDALSHPFVLLFHGSTFYNSTNKPVAKRLHMVSGTLVPLYTVFGLKLGGSEVL